MTQPPDFDQLIGSDVESSERARLQRVHSLLVQAGPPPELSPTLQAGPTLGMTLTRRPTGVRRRVLLLAATIAVLALAFLAGFIAGNNGGKTAGRIVQLTGTPAAPNAFASLQIEHVDTAGNWPMKLSVKGLPPLGAGQYYEAFVVRDGKPWAPCGSFKVAKGAVTVVQLNAPYKLKPGDSWDVMRMGRGGKPEAGVVVLQPINV